MTSAIEMLREDQTEELWQKCCGFTELSLEDFCAYVYNSLPRSYDWCHRLVTDVFVSSGNSSNKTSRILCIGLGSGEFAIELGREGYKIDKPDLYRAESVRARLWKNNVLLKKVEFREWDMGKGFTPYPDGVFDCILSVHALHFLKEPEITIREYFRVLKPSGGIILVEPRCMSKLYHVLQLNEEQLRGKLEACGLRTNRITSVDSRIIATALKPRYYFEMNGYRFLSAETKEDLAKVFRLRYQVYCVELGVEPENDSGLHVDEYDEYGVHFLALDDNNRPVGTLRALPNNSKGFPMESDFSLTAYMSKKGISRAVEGGRFAIKKALSPEARAIVGFGLMKGLIDYCRETGINDLFTTTQVKIVKRFAVTGFSQIGEPFEYPGTWAGVLWVPMHCDIREVYENYCGTVRGYSGLP
jgi:N-acyl-L-homoserine lactone synthetase/2-polyprenyl-3-methyl-5-hydroxy-6-metoxy-1,4-benzoquinol methylase